MGAGAKRPPTCFSPVNSTNVGISRQNLLTFSFNSFAALVKNVKLLPIASPKLLNLNQDHSSEKVFFLVKSLESWRGDNFSHRNGTVAKRWSHEHIYNLT